MRVSQTVKQAFVDGGYREPAGYPRNARAGITYALHGTYTDASTTFIDLRQNVVDINILRMAQGATIPDTAGDAALTPVDTPNVVAVAERAAFVFSGVLDGTVALSPLAMWSFIANSCLVWRPAGGGDYRETPLLEIADSVFKTVAVGRDDTGGTDHPAALFAKPTTHLLRQGPIWADLSQDVLGIKPLVAVDFAADVRVAVIFDGGAFPNTDWLPEDSGGSCDNTTKSITRRIRDALDVRATMNSIFGGRGPLAKLGRPR